MFPDWERPSYESANPASSKEVLPQGPGQAEPPDPEDMMSPRCKERAFDGGQAMKTGRL